MKAFYLLFLIIGFISCKNTKNLNIDEIRGNQITITGNIPADDSIAAFIAPYKEHIDKEMNAVLAFSPRDLKKTDGELNTALGNMMADAIMELANPVFKKRTGNSIDIVLLNFGGIRSSLNAGEVTTRTAYQLMPFENEVVVAELSGAQVMDMVRYLIDAGTAHPVAGIELILNSNNALKRVLVQGEPLETNKTYYVATSDYLYNGGDNMTFFSGTESTSVGYKIRNVLIDYFKKVDTIAPVRDQRFIREQ